MEARLNKVPIGLGIGLILPFIALIVVYFILSSNTSFITFLENSFVLKLQIQIISLAIVPNLVAFYIFIRLNYLYTARGMLIITFAYVIFAIIMFA